MQERLTPRESAILLALATYKYLTVSQIITLWIATHKPNVTRSMKRLLDAGHPLVDRNTFGFHPKKGRLEDIYFLTKHGASLLLEYGDLEENEVLVPRGKSTLFTQDYFHRKFTIDVQIALSLEAEKQGVEMVFFDRYFDKEGSARSWTLSSVAKITLGKSSFLVPDIVFLLEQGENQYFYCGEIYNGKDTKRVLTQLKKHVRALELWTPSIKYNLTKGNRVLCIFEYESALEAVMKRLKGDDFFANFSDYFLFKHLEQSTADSFDNWKNLDWAVVRMY